MRPASTFPAAVILALALPGSAPASTVEAWPEQDLYALEERAIRGLVLNVANRGDEPLEIPSHHFPEGGGLLLVQGGVEWRTSARLGLTFDRDRPPLQPGESVQWTFEAIHFGYSTIPRGGAGDDAEMMDIEGLFEIRYHVHGERSSIQTVRSAPFTLRCPAWWFRDLSRSMVLESIGPDTDPALVEAEIDRLIATVEGDNGDLPAAAARRLAILAPTRATGPLIALIERSFEAEDARSFQGRRITAALEALTAIGGPQAEQAALDALVQAQAMDFAWVAVRDVRIGAMQACGALGVDRSLPILLEIAAVEGMGDLPGTRLDQKRAAIRAIGELGDPATCPFLIGLCEHARNRQVHTWEKLLLCSAEALVSIGAPEGITYLEQLATELEAGSYYRARGALLREILNAPGDP